MSDKGLVNIEAKASLIGSISNTFNIVFNRGRKLPPETQLALDRFQQLLDGHQLNRHQLLKMVPYEWKWTLATLSDETQLIAALGPETLTWFSKTFGVREEWLAGDLATTQLEPGMRREPRIYDWPMGYKQPQAFVSRLSEMGWLNDKLRMTILAADYRTDSNGSLGKFIIVFSFPLAEWNNGETVIYRHLVFETLMKWEHLPCRFDAKALALWFHRTIRRYGPVPIVPATYDQVASISAGSAFPGPLIPWGFGGFDRLEDRVLRFGKPGDGEGESLIAKETDELESVVNYAHSCGLI